VLATDAVPYDAKYIEITQDKGIEEQTEVPAEVSEALWPTPRCPHCLPIEDKSFDSLQKLAETHIHVNGHQYVPAGRGTWTTRDNTSVIKAPLSHIGTQNPFLLCKLGDKSYEWFLQHSAEKRENLLKRLKDYGESGPGFDLGRHLQLMNSPTFSHDEKPIQIIGTCPSCGKTPNPLASS